MYLTNLLWVEVSNKGRREENQDAYMSMVGGDLAALAIADGMGGYSIGDKVAWNIITALEEELKLCDNFIPEYVALLLNSKYIQVNEYIYNSTKANSITAGSTISTLCFVDNKCISANVGDTLISRIRKGKFAILSKIHNIAAEEYEYGRITYSEYRNHDKKNILTQCIGVEPTISPYIFMTQYSSEDIYVICSDGLYNHIEEKDFIEKLNPLNISTKKQLETACSDLLEMAFNNGSNDNMTIIAVKIK